MILSEDLEFSVNTLTFCENWRAEKPVAARATGSPGGKNKKDPPTRKNPCALSRKNRSNYRKSPFQRRDPAKRLISNAYS
jgi:hypothetical protein